MTTLLYTDSGNVLGILGLSGEDIQEGLFERGDIEKMLRAELHTWLPAHADYFITEWESATADEHFRSDCLSMFCTYFCASKVAEGSLGIMSNESDGQNEYTRFASLDLKSISRDMEHKASKYKQYFLNTLEVAPISVVPFTVSTPSYDPVTG